MSPESTIRFDNGGGGYPEYLYETQESADLVPDLAAVTGVDLAFYQECDFLAVRRALSQVEVDDALDGLAAVAVPGSGVDIQYEKCARDTVDTMSPQQRLDVTRKLMSIACRDPRLTAIAQHADILGVVGQLLGEQPHLFQDMALLKPPGAGREKPWHQDNAFFHLAVGTPIVGVWIALDAATAENGCMRVLPGSHREGPVRHARLRDLQICDNDVEVPRVVAVPLPPGGLMFLDSLLQHGTPASRTSTRRRALQFHYTVADAPHVSNEERRAVFGLVDGAEC